MDLDVARSRQFEDGGTIRVSIPSCVFLFCERARHATSIFRKPPYAESGVGDGVHQSARLHPQQVRGGVDSLLLRRHHGSRGIALEANVSKVQDARQNLAQIVLLSLADADGAHGLAHLMKIDGIVHAIHCGAPRLAQVMKARRIALDSELLLPRRWSALHQLVEDMEVPLLLLLERDTRLLKQKRANLSPNWRRAVVELDLEVLTKAR